MFGQLPLELSWLTLNMQERLTAKIASIFVAANVAEAETEYKTIVFLFHSYMCMCKRKRFMAANINYFKLKISMAKQQLSPCSIDRIAQCARAMIHWLTMSKVLKSMFELDTSSDDRSEIYVGGSKFPSNHHAFRR